MNESQELKNCVLHNEYLVLLIELTSKGDLATIKTLDWAECFKY